MAVYFGEITSIPGQMRQKTQADVVVVDDNDNDNDSGPRSDTCENTAPVPARNQTRWLDLKDYIHGMRAAQTPAMLFYLQRPTV